MTIYEGPNPKRVPEPEPVDEPVEPVELEGEGED